MPFTKGKSGNAKGKKPGTKSKTTEELRGLVQSFIEANINQLQADFDLLEPKDRLLFIEKMLKMIIPAPITSISQLSESDLDILIEKLKNESKKD